jgi:hypothetical protein
MQPIGTIPNFLLPARPAAQPPAPAQNQRWAIDLLQLNSVPLAAAPGYPAPAAIRSLAPVVTNPPGQGLVVAQPGAPVQSNAGQQAGAGFDGRIASQTLATLKRAGGVSAVYLGRANGNREVAVWAAPGFDPNRPYEVLVYNRGIEGDNTKSLDGQFLAESLRNLNAQGRNVLLVLPKSPTEMHTWFAGREDLGALVPEALAQFRALAGINLGEPQERWLMAHSGGGKSVQNAMEKPNAPHFDKILLADSTYGTWAAGTWAALHRTQPGTQVATVVTEHNRERATSQLANHGLRVDMMPRYVHPDHNGVPSFMIDKFLGAGTLSFSTVR